ncbi:glyoxalase [Pedobacter sp.]|uniref:glyoxalase n=1 Tax=Pedobacter sp. TaxID=1411316 RepID=UPI003BAA0168
MKQNAKSIRPFIGAKDFEISRAFYKDLGFDEVSLGEQMSLFSTDKISFYLQKAYVKDWIDNSMIFIEVGNVNNFYKDLLALDLPAKYKNVRLTPVRNESWGSECFLHDPSGILWHFGAFY